MRILSGKKLLVINCFYLLLVFVLLTFVLLMIMSCTSGVNVGEANKVLDSFTVEWPEGFEGKCGSKYPLTVTVKALAQDESVYNWSGIVDIIPTNVDVEVVPSQINLTDGTKTVEFMLRHNSEEPITTNIRISGGGVITTLSESITVYPNITGLTLNKKGLLIHKDGTFQLAASVEPQDAWDKTVSWSTDDGDIATVDKNGIVTGINYGITTIKAKTNDGGYEDTCDIDVTIVTWHTMLGGNHHNSGSSVHQTSEGGYIIAGSSPSDDITGLLQNNHGGNDYYVAKLNSDGSVAWHTMLGGSGSDRGYSVQQTSDWGYIVAGYSNSTNITGLLQNNHGGSDYYIVKLNSDGSVAWHTMLGGSDSDVGYSVQQTSDGGYIVAGYSGSTNITGLLQNNHGGSDYYIVKLNSDGDIIWHTTLGGNSEDWGYSIKQTFDGGYIVAGYSNSTNITGLLQNNHGGNDYYIVKLNSDGSVVWHTMLGGSGDDWGYSVKQTSDGGYIVAGESTSDMVGVELLQNNHGSHDCYVVKLNSDGSITWHTMLGGSDWDGGRSIQQTCDGGYIIIGFSVSEDMIGLIQDHGVGEEKIYVAKLW